jgi:hypothetical protein
MANTLLTSTVLREVVTSPFVLLAKVEAGKVVYTQLMEDSFATARSSGPAAPGKSSPILTDR